MSRNFMQLLEARWAEGTAVCVGLDSDYRQLPACLACELDEETSPIEDVQEERADHIFTFNQQIILATADNACAFKPNRAFYEEHEAAGVRALAQTVAFIHEVAPEVPVILDGKYGDIGNTNRGYVNSAFGALGADAVTVSPYLGAEALQPFLECGARGIIVLCKTSNQGSGEFQDLLIDGVTPLYQWVARNVAESWNSKGNCALVVGATFPEQLAKVRAIAPALPILIPGYGAQGGELEATVRAGSAKPDQGLRGHGMIINSSRGIIFASAGDDFADAAGQATLRLRREINSYL